MIEANKTDKGSTSGIILGIANSKNLRTIAKSKSLPANSAMNNHTDCSMNMKKRITNTMVNVVRKVFNKYLSRIFT